MAAVGKPYVKIEYEGKDISEDISKYITDFSYVDNVHGKADEIEITFDDRQGLFQGAWYPDKKATVTAEIQHEGETMKCGIFYIDEVAFNGTPDTVKWHGVSIDPNSKLRTKKSKGYNTQTLLQIAKDIAGQHGLTVDDGTKTITLQNPDTTQEQQKLLNWQESLFKASNIDKTLFYNTIRNLINLIEPILLSLEAKNCVDEAAAIRKGIGDNLYDASGELAITDDIRNKRVGASKLRNIVLAQIKALRLKPKTTTRTLGLGLQKIKIERSTQNNETDLAYLKRISAQYGLAFNVKPPKLVFYSAFQLEDAPSVVTVDKRGCISFEFTDKLHDTYSDVDVSSHNPYKNETISNATELQNTQAEQIKLQSLYKFMSNAASGDDIKLKAFVRAAKSNVDSAMDGLASKGFGEQFDALSGGYGVLLADQSVTGAIRFANLCKDIRAQLLKIQSQGNKVTKYKDAYSGGQSANVLTVRVRAEDKDQADAIGKAALHSKNSETRTGSITMPGNLRLVAGNNFDASGFGRMDDKYNIISSTHNISADYTTSVSFKLGAITLKTTKRGKVIAK